MLNQKPINLPDLPAEIIAIILACLDQEAISALKAVNSKLYYLLITLDKKGHGLYMRRVTQLGANGVGEHILTFLNNLIESPQIQQAMTILLTYNGQSYAQQFIEFLAQGENIERLTTLAEFITKLDAVHQPIDAHEALDDILLRMKRWMIFCCVWQRVIFSNMLK